MQRRIMTVIAILAVAFAAHAAGPLTADSPGVNPDVSIPASWGKVVAAYSVTIATTDGISGFTLEASDGTLRTVYVNGRNVTLVQVIRRTQ